MSDTVDNIGLKSFLNTTMYGEYSTVIQGNPLMYTHIYLHCIWGTKNPNANGYYKYYSNDDRISLESSESYKLGVIFTNLTVFGKYAVSHSSLSPSPFF